MSCHFSFIKVKKGLSAIEIIVSISVLSMVILAISSIFTFNLSMITLTKARSVGLGLATEKLENLKNMPYDSLATQHGTIYPSGNIPDNENVSVSGLKLRVDTVITYVDNPYDGNYDGTIAGKPKDIYPYDYKKVTVKVYLATGNREVATLSTDIAGKVAETSSNTGIILIKVLDANGNPLPGASVHITNINPNPDVDITTTTDNLGQALIPKMPPDTSKGYHTVVTKSGYSTSQTYPADTTTPTPVLPDFSVIAQQTTTLTFAIDQLANLTVKVVDEAENPIVGVNLTVIGQKLINTTPAVPKFTQTHATDSSGIVALNGIEWDSYDFTAAGRTILSSSPAKPVNLSPLASQTVILMVTTGSGKAIINSINPNSAASGSTVAVDITGDNLIGVSGVKLRRSGQADIVASPVDVQSHDLVSATFNLNGAVAGDWDLVVTKTNGSTVQYRGFNVGN